MKKRTNNIFIKAAIPVILTAIILLSNGILISTDEVVAIAPNEPFPAPSELCEWNFPNPPSGVPGFVYDTTKNMTIGGEINLEAGTGADVECMSGYTQKSFSYDASTPLSPSGGELSRRYIDGIGIRKSCGLWYAEAFGLLDSGYSAQATNEFIEIKVQTCSLYNAQVADYGNTGAEAKHACWNDPLQIEIPFRVTQRGTMMLDAFYLNLTYEASDDSFIADALVKAHIILTRKICAGLWEIVRDINGNTLDYEGRLDLDPGNPSGEFEVGWEVGDLAEQKQFDLIAGEYRFRVVAYFTKARATATTFGSPLWLSTNMRTSDRFHAVMHFEEFLPTPPIEPIDPVPYGGG